MIDLHVLKRVARHARKQRVRGILDNGDASELFEAIRGQLAANLIGDAGVISVSGGIAELEVRDDVDSFVARAEAALADAKRVRRGSAVVSGATEDRQKANGTLHEIAPGEIVLEG